jgi:hypothetical protein
MVCQLVYFAADTISNAYPPLCDRSAKALVTTFIQSTKRSRQFPMHVDSREESDDEGELTQDLKHLSVTYT